jgi:dTDP-4-dehydrorhamnose reductase
MRILLIGALGQLGTDFRSVLAAHDIVAVDKEEVDVTDAAQVDSLTASARPELVINCTAFNRVDEAEDNPGPCFAVNTFAVRNIALACRHTNVPLVHFSSDYVFNSRKRHPLAEDALPNPQSIYGVSKLAGEHMARYLWEKHYVIRTCGLYGYAGSREKGTNFVETMLKLGQSGKQLKVVDDQHCTPTSTLDLARATAQLIGGAPYGLYHLTNAGGCTWYEFARAIFQLAGLTPEVLPVASGVFPTRARRPAYSVLDNAAFRAAGFAGMRHWREALAEYISGRGSGAPGQQ